MKTIILSSIIYYFILLFRYYAIVYPFDAMKIHTKSRTRKILAATWIIPVVIACPFTYAKSIAFNVFSDQGMISRQICTDKFSEIDVAMHGESAKSSGHFRRGFFMFLFVGMYLIPMLIIVMTCVCMAARLLKPLSIQRNDTSHGQTLLRKREENKRRVSVPTACIWEKK